MAKWETFLALCPYLDSQGVDKSATIWELNLQSEADQALQELDHQWRRETIRWAADQIQDDFPPDTWNAFWMTAINGLPADIVARQMRKPIGAIHIAKSQVMRRLQEKVAQLDEQYVEVKINE